jgi:hypothetical protein
MKVLLLILMSCNVNHLQLEGKVGAVNQDVF